MSSKPRITYWKGRGRAETVRLMFAAVGVEWEDGPYLNSAADLAKLRKDGRLLFEQVPLVEWQGRDLVQCEAIVRYIAKQHSLAGKTDEEALRIDMLMMGARDFMAPFYPFGFMPAETYAANTTKTMDRYMPIFNQVLDENATGQYLVGDSLSMADVCLFEVLLNVSEQRPNSLEQHSSLKAFFDHMNSLDCFKKYLQSDKRFPPNNTEYCDAVKRTLGGH